MAPKNRKNYIDIDYLGKISVFIKENFSDVFLIHGAGNIGHNFLKDLMRQTGFSLKEVLKKYSVKIKLHIIYWYKKIDRFFPYLNRIRFEEINKFSSFYGKIVGGDIDWGKLTIISGDDIFSYMANFKDRFTLKIVLTDVNGVLDNKGRVIREINKEYLKNINFWCVKNDLTGGMQSKVRKLLGKGGVYIINGYNFENLKMFLKEPNKAVFTKIC